MHRITVRLDVDGAAEHDRGSALTRNEAVGVVRKRPTPPARCQHASPPHRLEAAGRQVQRRASHESEINLAAPQRLHRHVGGHQRRRTRRVNRDRSTAQVKEVRHPRRRHCAARGQHVGTVTTRVAAQCPVIALDDAHEHAAPRAPQITARVACVSESVVRLLQQQTVLRIHHGRVNWRHLKQGRVKLCRVGQCAERRQLEAVRKVKARPPLRRNSRHLVAALPQRLPQPAQVTRTRVPPRHANHRDRSVTRERCRLGEVGRRLSGVEQLPSLVRGYTPLREEFQNLFRPRHQRTIPWARSRRSIASAGLVSPA